MILISEYVLTGIFLLFLSIANAVFADHATTGYTTCLFASIGVGASGIESIFRGQDFFARGMFQLVAITYAFAGMFLVIHERMGRFALALCMLESSVFMENDYLRYLFIFCAYVSAENKGFEFSVTLFITSVWCYVVPTNPSNEPHVLIVITSVTVLATLLIFCVQRRHHG